VSQNKINPLISSLSIRADLSALTTVHLHPNLLASTPVKAVPSQLVAVVPGVQLQRHLQPRAHPGRAAHRDGSDGALHIGRAGPGGNVVPAGQVIVLPGLALAASMVGLALPLLQSPP
jgi:hypothetical protein